MKGIELRPPNEAASKIFSTLPSTAQVQQRADRLQLAWDGALKDDALFADSLIGETNSDDTNVSALVNLEKLPAGGFLYVCVEDEGVDAPLKNTGFVYRFYNGMPMTENQFYKLEDDDRAAGISEIGLSVDDKIIYGEHEEAGRVDSYSVVEGLLVVRSYKALRDKSAKSVEMVKTIREVEKKIVESLNDNKLNRIRNNERVQLLAGVLGALISDMPEEVPDVIDTLDG